MDIIAFNESSTANSRIKKIIENPDSTSGVVTVPSTIATGETITIPAGRTAILPDVTVEGDLLVNGTVFIPTGTTYTQQTIKTEAISNVAGTTVVNVTDVVSKVGDQTIAGNLTITSGALRGSHGSGNVVSNTAVGDNALHNNTTGSYNTANGVGALHYNTAGSSNTASGVDALQSNTTFSNVSGFGYNSQVTGSNQVQLGDSATTTYVYGTVANRSDERDKADIRDTVLGLDFIQSLRPVDYKWDMREDYKTERPKEPEIEKPSESGEDYEVKLAEYESIQEAYKLEMDEWLESNKLANIVRDGSKKRNRYHQGFIAQEVLALGVEFGGIQDHSIKGGDDVLSIGYDELIAPMVKAIQELKAEIEILKGGN